MYPYSKQKGDLYSNLLASRTQEKAQPYDRMRKENPEAVNYHTSGFLLSRHNLRVSRCELVESSFSQGEQAFKGKLFCACSEKLKSDENKRLVSRFDHDLMHTWHNYDRESGWRPFI
jgi:hypothetical protein